MSSFLSHPPLFTGLRETTGSESDGGDSSSTKSEGANGTVATAAIQPKKVKGVGFGDIFKDKAIKLRPRSTEVENDFLPVEKVCTAVSLSLQHNVKYPEVHCRTWCLRLPTPSLRFRCSHVLAVGPLPFLHIVPLCANSFPPEAQAPLPLLFFVFLIQILLFNYSLHSILFCIRFRCTA